MSQRQPLFMLCPAADNANCRLLQKQRELEQAAAEEEEEDEVGVQAGRVGAGCGVEEAKVWGGKNVRGGKKVQPAAGEEGDEVRGQDGRVGAGCRGEEAKARAGKHVSSEV